MSSPSNGADLNNIQGDVLAGLPKKTQTYFFFQIDTFRIPDFRAQLAKLVPLVTTTAQVMSDKDKIAQNKKAAANGKTAPRLLTLSGVNIVFSRKGLVQLGIKESIGDSAFDNGMLLDAQNLGDKGTTSSSGTFDPDWIPAFKSDIHGMILVSGDSHATVAATLAKIEDIFAVGTYNATMYEMLRIVGDVRPGQFSGHEHFGFLDGISQPAIESVDKHPNPGQETVDQGIFLMGRKGDGVASRPPWALDGSLLAFRYLFQLVPEFDTFLKQNPVGGLDLPPAQGSELLGARLIGRWKSGAPIDNFPTHDDPEVGADPQKNNDFQYDHPGDRLTQTRCPFAAHTRKTYPRADLEKATPPINIDNRRILRRGIQFGPEVSTVEAASGKTHFARGLLFAAYQSSITNGFQFIQQSWANSTTFPFGKPVTPGFDPIIGQTNSDGPRTMSGTNPNSQTNELDLSTEWVVPKGGEYFFVPSLAVLKEVLAHVGPQAKI